MRLALRVTHASQQPAAYACLYITTIAAVLAVSARLLARRLTRVSLWYDDYFALLGFFFALVWAAYVLYWLHEGLGLFLSDIRASVDHVLEVSRFTLWELELMYAFSLAMSKLSILALYWRLFRTSSIKLPIQVLAGCTVIWLILRVRPIPLLIILLSSSVRAVKSSFQKYLRFTMTTANNLLPRPSLQSSTAFPSKNSGSPLSPAPARSTTPNSSLAR